MSDYENVFHARDGIVQLLATRTGLVFSPSRQADVDSAIKRAMATANVSSIAMYYELVRDEKLSLDSLIAAVTIQETYFFRERDQFDFLRQHVLPDFRMRRGAAAPLRLWSAGCATGEEAYSLAILLEEEGFTDASCILATDLSQAALAKARKGVYGAWSLRGDQNLLQARYFQSAHGRHTIASRFRERVNFQYLNLACKSDLPEAGYPQQMDLILCRNVLIYFDRETIQKVTTQLIRSLSEGGWLVLGPSDPPIWNEPSCETITTSSGVYYRRRGESGMAYAAPKMSSADPADELRPVVTPEPTLIDWPPPSLQAEELDRVETGKAKDLEREVDELLRRGDYHGVMQLAEGHKESPDIYAIYIRASANLGHTNSAQHAAEEAVRMHPLSAELRYLHAMLLLELDRCDEAAIEVERTIYLDRSLAAVHFMAGTISLRRGDKAAAVKAFRNAYWLSHPRHPDEIVKFSEGERAGDLAEAAHRMMALSTAQRGPLA